MTLPTWHSQDEGAPYKITPVGWMLVLLRGTVLGGVTFGCLILLLLVRCIERPIFGAQRPVSPYITQFVCRMAFIILGIRFSSIGTPMKGPGAAVANHASWLDIFSLNARKRVYFVSKSEVAKWPGIGWLARATGTVFIRRAARDAKVQKTVFEERLTMGHNLMFFPEGTSTDGLRVLPFKSTLFAAFFAGNIRRDLKIQPVTVNYFAPEGQDIQFYGWWGDMDFAPHLLKTLSVWKQGKIEVIYHDAVNVSDFSDRKKLAAHCEQAVRSGLRVGK
ncbi:lysophospholipid acyltransferase family protein [Cochlodiniinecator piscidefendens]|uniref:lysophospholipid acyltransferase family protein n=1 Tax=Cochlodiniinecator piscidefendens TaxID=2715756 RepID=UPI00140D9B6D|nr:lysophospholipid acyltransferase family protein [Cochlodiniinecator piscidefendens]